MAEPKKDGIARNATSGRYTQLQSTGRASSSATAILTTGQKDRIKEALSEANRKVGLFKKQ